MLFQTQGSPAARARGADGGCAAPRRPAGANAALRGASCPRHASASSSARRGLWVEAGHVRNPGLARTREGDSPNPSCFQKNFKNSRLSWQCFDEAERVTASKRGRFLFPRDRAQSDEAVGSSGKELVALP